MLASNAGLRAAIVPGPPEKPGEPAGEHAHSALARICDPASYLGAAGAMVDRVLAHVKA